jgi:hypothetical protein
MRKLSATILLLLGIPGCTVPAWSPPPPAMVPVEQAAAAFYPNPVIIPISDPQCAWEAIVDVIDDYFKVAHEEPVRGDTFNDGRIETFYEVSPTILEPWRRDTAGEYERVENTLQTIRRKAVVLVHRCEGGYEVQVSVFKELEDLPRPEHASAGAATFRYDSSFTRVVNPPTPGAPGECWIPLGRDPVLEQRIIGHLIYNCNELGYNMQTQAPAFGPSSPEYGPPEYGPPDFGVQDFKKPLPPGGAMQ